MKRKILRDVANTLPEMLVGWRMSDADLDRLSDLTDGILHLDLLHQTAEHSHAGLVQLHVVGELSAWLVQQLAAARIPVSELTEAQLDARIRTDRIATDKRRIVSFDVDCQSRVTIGERTYKGRLVERHVWHRRKEI